MNGNSFPNQSGKQQRYNKYLAKPRLLGQYCKLAILVFSLTIFGRSAKRAGIEGEKARSVTYGTDLELGW